MVNDVTWQIIKQSSSFRRKRNGLDLDAGPFNVGGKHNLTFSGISQSRAIDVQLTPAGKIVLYRKNAKKSSRSVKKGYEQIVLSKNKGAAVKAIQGLTLKGHKYRPELAKAATRKYFKLVKAAARLAKAAAAAPKAQ